MFCVSYGFAKLYTLKIPTSLFWIRLRSHTTFYSSSLWVPFSEMSTTNKHINNSKSGFQENHIHHLNSIAWCLISHIEVSNSNYSTVYSMKYIFLDLHDFELMKKCVYNSTCKICLRHFMITLDYDGITSFANHTLKKSL